MRLCVRLPDHPWVLCAVLGAGEVASKNPDRELMESEKGLRLGGLLLV